MSKRAINADSALKRAGLEARLIGEYTAALYLGMSRPQFRRHCPIEPIEIIKGAPRWDLRALDAWIDRLTGVGLSAESAPNGDRADEAISRLRHGKAAKKNARRRDQAPSL